MKKTFLHFGFLSFILSAAIIPVPASAASSKPTCTIEVRDEDGDIIKQTKGSITIEKGEEIEISWKSNKAKKATDSSGSTTLSGKKTEKPTKSTSYSYKFSSDTKNVACSVTVNVVSGEVDSVTTDSKKPTITGKAEGVKSVWVSVRNDDGKAVFNKEVKVKSGKFSVKMTKNLAFGEYSISVSGSKNGTAFATGELVIGEEKKNSAKNKSTLAVSSIPLLAGGTTRAGASVPVSYLQTTNIGKESLNLKGFTLRQSGTASASVISSLKVVDDKGVERGVATNVVFQNGQAFVPAEVSFAPGEMKLFTIRAVLAGNLGAEIGKNLMIDVASVESDASLKANLPIKGTTWVLGF